MSDEIYIGQKAGGLETSPKLDPVSKVILYVDNENVYEAGTDGGRVLEVTCPYATQQMANNILAALSGYQYQPARATDALMDPAAEFGDAVTVGDAYTMIADMDLTFDALMTSDVGAPGQEEIESEYPYQSQQTTEANRQLAETRSLIKKTAEEITLRVDGLEDDYTEVSTTLDGLTVTDPSGQTIIDGSKIQTSNLYVNAANISGTLTIGQLPSSVAQTSDIPDKTSDLINDSGFQTALGVTQIVNGTITTDYVNALEITAGSVSASNVTAGVLQAASISVEGLLTLQYGDVAYGLVGASIAGNTPGAVLTDSTATNYFIATRSGARMSAANEAQIYVSNGGCYCSSEMQVFSDRSLKNTITYGLEKYEKFFENLRPCFYKLNSDGEGAKFRIGLIAQDIKDTLKESGLSGGDLALLGNSERLCTIGYGEIIPLNTWKIQQLEKRVKELEANLIG